MQKWLVFALAVLPDSEFRLRLLGPGDEVGTERAILEYGVWTPEGLKAFRHKGELRYEPGDTRCAGRILGYYLSHYKSEIFPEKYREFFDPIPAEKMGRKLLSGDFAGAKTCDHSACKLE